MPFLPATHRKKCGQNLLPNVWTRDTRLISQLHEIQVLAIKLTNTSTSTTHRGLWAMNVNWQSKLALELAYPQPVFVKIWKQTQSGWTKRPAHCQNALLAIWPTQLVEARQANSAPWSYQSMQGIEGDARISIYWVGDKSWQKTR